jgi:hypothetical protein
VKGSKKRIDLNRALVTDTIGIYPSFGLVVFKTCIIFQMIELYQAVVNNSLEKIYIIL